MSVLWTDKTAIEATGGTAQGGHWQAQRVVMDSRQVRPGDLFIALKGERVDAHQFVNDVLAKGAAACVVSDIPAQCKGPLLVVQDTMRALEALGVYARARSKAKIIGLTGSVGKTSTKEMLRLALAPHGDVYASSGNFNNHIGVPFNLANLPPDAKLAVFEMGMNHHGEIAHLTKMVRPHIGIITNVEAVHLEFFESVADIAKAKAEIFEGVNADGVAVLNADNAYFKQLSEAARARGIQKIISCGEAKYAHCRLLSVSPQGEVEALIAGHTVRYTLGAVGKHWATGSLLVLAAVQALGLDVEKSAKALAAFKEPDGRGATVKIDVDGKSLWLIDDSYNASPASMSASFAKADLVWQSLGKKGRKVAALGDMLELGHDGPALHAKLADDLLACGFHQVFAAGPLMMSLFSALSEQMQGEHTTDAKSLLPILTRALQNDDVLLIKGSHGSKMYLLAETLKNEESQKKETKHAV